MTDLSPQSPPPPPVTPSAPQALPTPSPTSPTPSLFRGAPPAQVTGTAAGLSAAGIVLASAIVHYYTGIQPSPATVGAGSVILTYVLGTYLHVPQN